MDRAPVTALRVALARTARRRLAAAALRRLAAMPLRWLAVLSAPLPLRPPSRRAGRSGLVAPLLAGPVALALAGIVAPTAAAPPVDSLRVECASCHRRAHGLQVAVGGQATAARWTPVCATCHAGQHEAQRKLYAGKGAAGLEPMPAGMLLARVSCAACHGEQRPEATTAGPRASEADCLACHGPEFRGMLPRWQAGAAWRLAEVRRFVATAERLRGRSAGVDSLVAAARGNVRLVEEGQAVHNVVFADAALRTAVAQVQAAFRASGATRPAAPRLGPERADGVCVACHFGVETASATAFGTPFAHGDHVLDAGLRCTGCHTAAGYFAADARSLDPRHGRLTLAGVGACRSCHHSEQRAAACARCHRAHELADRALRPRVRVRFAITGREEERAFPFAHGPHRAFPCTLCHGKTPDQPAASNCGSCHGPHHQAKSVCTACHGAVPWTVHPADAVHVGCSGSGCHAEPAVSRLRPTRELCLVCHQDRVSHHAGAECASCHEVPLEAAAPSRGGVP